MSSMPPLWFLAVPHTTTPLSAKLPGLVLATLRPLAPGTIRRHEETKGEIDPFEAQRDDASVALPSYRCASFDDSVAVLLRLLFPQKQEVDGHIGDWNPFDHGYVDILSDRTPQRMLLLYTVYICLCFGGLSS